MNLPALKSARRAYYLMLPWKLILAVVAEGSSAEESFDTVIFPLTISPTSCLYEGRRTLIVFMRRYLELVEAAGGSPCGGSSEGRFLAMFMHRYMSADLLSLYGKIKQLFDPNGILNPGVKHEVDSSIVLRHFRVDYDQGIIPKE